jgi:hypothetical protein
VRIKTAAEAQVADFRERSASRVRVEHLLCATMPEIEPATAAGNLCARDRKFNVAPPDWGRIS